MHKHRLKFSLAVHSKEELWCYECNTDLRQGHIADCNDPYTPDASDLVACPQNESHHCHKSIVLCTYMLNIGPLCKTDYLDYRLKNATPSVT
jgi:hypothetical protein